MFLPGFFWCTSSNPYTLSDRNMWFSVPNFRSESPYISTQNAKNVYIISDYQTKKVIFNISPFNGNTLHPCFPFGVAHTFVLDIN